MKADVAVVGVGTMGSMALWRLAQRGISAIGFEQFGVGHDRGAAGGETRLFRTAYMEGPEYVPLLRAAYDGWRELERETRRHLLTLTGGLTIGDPDAETMRGVLESARSFDLEHLLLDGAAARQRYPQHRLFPGEAMLLEHQAGFLRPEIAVQAATRRAEELGAVVHRHARVQSIEVDPNGVAIRVGNEEHHVDRVLVTAGPWTGSLLGEWDERLSVRRLVMTWFAADDPALFTPQRFPVFTRRREDVNIFGLPSVDGYTVKVSLATDYGDVADPDALDLDVPPAELMMITSVVGELLPGLVPEPLRVSAYMDAFTPAHRAVVGPAEDLPNTILMCGFSGHGFKLAPVVGEVAADLLMHGETDHEIGCFDVPGGQLAPVPSSARRA